MCETKLVELLLDLETITQPPSAICRQGLPEIIRFLHLRQSGLLWLALIHPGIPNPRGCQAYGPGLGKSVVAHPCVSFTIRSIDLKNNQIFAGGNYYEVAVEMVPNANGRHDQRTDFILNNCDSTSQKHTVAACIVDNADGSYSVTYDARVSGSYSIGILCQQQHIRQSPFNVTVNHGEICAANSHCTLNPPRKDQFAAAHRQLDYFHSELVSLVAGQEAILHINAFDEWGNPCKLSTESSIEVECEKLDSFEVCQSSMY